MSSLKAEFEALKQQHEFTVMELTDLKEEYDRIKKLNNTILENMLKQPSDMLNEIKVIVDGNLYSQKIIQLQSELQLCRSQMNDEVEKKVQQLMKFKKEQKVQMDHEHDYQKCDKCKKLIQQCQSCQKLADSFKRLQKIMSQKDDKINLLIIQIDTKKQQLQSMKSNKNNQKNDKIIQLQKINKMMKQNIQTQQSALRQQIIKRKQLDQQWQNQYNNIQNQLNSALQELDQYRQQHTTQLSETHNENELRRQGGQGGKKEIMLKEIKNILGELGNNRRSITNNTNISGTRLTMLNPNQSRLSTHDTDFSSFSIKDAINRPNQLTFY